jgi:hypothetical protein
MLLHKIMRNACSSQMPDPKFCLPGFLNQHGGVIQDCFLDDTVTRSIHGSDDVPHT